MTILYNRNLLFRKGERPNTFIGLNGDYETTTTFPSSAKLNALQLNGSEKMVFSQERKYVSSEIDNYFRSSFLDISTTLISRSVSQERKLELTAPSNARFMRISYNPDNRVALVIGEWASYFCPAPEDLDLTIVDGIVV